MSTRFAERVVLITGASSGVGKAVALRVAAEGAAVVLGAYLLSKEASFVTGAALAIDGGFTAQ